MIDRHVVVENSKTSATLPPVTKVTDIEEVKQQYRDQTEEWNKHLDDSKRMADERLQKLLEKHNKK